MSSLTDGSNTNEAVRTAVYCEKQILDIQVNEAADTLGKIYELYWTYKQQNRFSHC